MEAGFDFADEDLAFITREELDRQLAEAESDAAAILRQVDSRRESSAGVRAVLVGRPNTGKSSLFNALAGDRAALVSDHPGTTRDYLTAELDLDGVKCQLIDTAGTSGRGREEEVERGTSPRLRSRGTVTKRSKGDIERAAASAAANSVAGARGGAVPRFHPALGCVGTRRIGSHRLASRRIVVLTKCDAPRQIGGLHAALETSSLTGRGIAALRDATAPASGRRGEAGRRVGRRHERALRRFASAGRPMPRPRPSSRRRRPRGVGGGRDTRRDGRTWQSRGRGLYGRRVGSDLQPVLRREVDRSQCQARPEVTCFRQT